MISKPLRPSWLVCVCALASLIAVACTTDLGSAELVSFGRSRLLGATSANVLRIVEKDGVVVWLDSAANVFSCPTSGCDGKATLLTSASAVYGGATYGQYSGVLRRVPAVIAVGSVFWTTGGSIYRCPLSGCPDGPVLVIDQTNEIQSLVSDGTTLAWSDTGRTISICAAADCKPRSATTSCAVDADCGADRPLCSSSGQCIVCDYGRNGACKGSTPTCATDSTCVECDPDVSFGTPTCAVAGKTICDRRTRTCGQCATSDDCSLGQGFSQVCVNQACAHCNGDFGSGKSVACPSPDTPVCNTGAGVCEACGASCAAPNECRPLGCLTPCAGPADCDQFHACAQSFCSPIKLSNGTICQTGTQCAAGACTGGICGKATGDACASDGECQATVCAADKKCGAPDGTPCFASTQCRSGACYQRVCGGPSQTGGVTQPIPSTLLVVGGRLYYSSGSFSAGTQTASIVSCPVSECPASTTLVHAVQPGASAFLLGGDAQSLFFADSGVLPPGSGGFSPTGASGELFRCDLPACNAPVDLGVGAAFAVEVAGNDVYVLASNESTAVHCTRDGCPSLTAVPLPDPDLGSSNASYQTLGNRPFAFDTTAIYWATSSIFGNPGNLVVATPP